jgi:hypothetical protein
MQGFSSSFLLFFYQIAFGGLLALAATPFHELDRAFYKSTGGVLFVIAVLGFWGKSFLYRQNLSADFSWITALQALLHLLFVIVLGIYIMSLWGERAYLRARAFAGSILTGLAGLLLTAYGFYDAGPWWIEVFLYSLSFFLSSLLLGSVTVGMLIGHWYLIDTGQTLDPFIRIYKFFVISLIVQAAFIAASFLLLYLVDASAGAEGIGKLWNQHSTLLATRLILGCLAPLVLSAMIWRTLTIPHTMAATGLFYIALLGVFVGEILGKQILALTSLPF